MGYLLYDHVCIVTLGYNITVLDVLKHMIVVIYTILSYCLNHFSISQMLLV